MAEQTHAIAAPSQRFERIRASETAWDVAPEVRRAARGRRVARDLVELSRLQRGDEKAHTGPVDLASLLRAVCADYPHVVVTGSDRLPLFTDSRRLVRVLTALLDNACMHGAPPVSVHFDALQIVVTDSGPGLDPALLARATEPFVTGERARGRGVGLGLAIAARQATVLGARLVLENAPDVGAVARICLDEVLAPVACGA